MLCEQSARTGGRSFAQLWFLFPPPPPHLEQAGMIGVP